VLALSSSSPAVAEVDPREHHVHDHVHGLDHILLWRLSASKQMCKLLEIFQKFTNYLQKVNNIAENFWTVFYNSKSEIEV
jgi:hypothetical protein